MEGIATEAAVPGSYCSLEMLGRMSEFCRLVNRSIELNCQIFFFFLNLGDCFFNFLDDFEGLKAETWRFEDDETSFCGNKRHVKKSSSQHRMICCSLCLGHGFYSQ